MLSRREGAQYIEVIEDAVQSALMTALESWTIAGLPDNPSAWLFRVAHNNLMGELRQRTRRRRILEENAKEDIDTPENGPGVFLAGEVRDNLLQMLFVCCDEAIPVESQLLLALMQLHAARMTARLDRSGGLLLLEEQDRELWDRQQIQIGLEWLAKSAQGDAFSRYHAEAGIAAEHCLAPSFQETRWDKVAESYSLLERIAPSAIHQLNRAVAVAEWRGPAAGLAVLDGFEPPAWLAGS